jgi:TRAP-type C4-dicarboxylate transport system permease small subunit
MKQVHDPTTPGHRPLLDRLLRPMEDAAMIFAAVVTFITMILVSVDALMRYLFNAPLSFGYYLTENYLMIAMMTMPLAWGFRTGGYIRIEGMVQRLPSRALQRLIRAGLVVSSAYVAVLAWVAGAHFLEAYRTGEVDPGLIDWPVSWSWVWVPLGCGLLALRLLITAFGPVEPLEEHHDLAEDSV